MSGAYPLVPIPSSRNDQDRDSGDEMTSPPNDGTSRSTPAHSSARHSHHSRPRRVPYLPQPSDVHTSPDDPVSEQAAELLHEFVHPHHHHNSRDNLFETEEELDDAGDDAAVIAKEREEMRSRVWWRRPSALWYARFRIPLRNACSPNHSILRRFLSVIPFVLIASTTTAAPKIQVITRLVCKSLRPEYSDQSGADPPITFFSASDDEETKLCNADPVVQAASAEFVTCERFPRTLPERSNLTWSASSDYHCNRYLELPNYCILGISKLTPLHGQFYGSV